MKSDDKSHGQNYHDNRNFSIHLHNKLFQNALKHAHEQLNTYYNKLQIVFRKISVFQSKTHHE